MSLSDPAEQHQQRQARDAVMARPARLAMTRYLEGMTRRNELIPGGADAVAALVVAHTGAAAATRETRRNAAAAAKGEPRPDPLPIGSTADAYFARTVGFLEIPEGRAYLNPLCEADPKELPVVAMARRLGMPKDDAESLYRQTAAAFAGREGASLALSLFHKLIPVESGRFLVGAATTTTAPAPEPSERPPGQPYKPAGRRF